MSDKKSTVKKAKAQPKAKAAPKPKAAPKADKPTDLASLRAKYINEIKALKRDRAKAGKLNALKAQYLKDTATLQG
tara:strand:- start:234 stop:461 length:228 start_codon:yes stop_codon:yes gene_type:complete